MTNKIIDITKKIKKQERYETICIFCGLRTMQPANAGIALKDIKCADCKVKGGVILTGQQYDEVGDVK